MHMPMFTTTAALIFLVASAVGVFFHIWNHRNAGWLHGLDKDELIKMYQQGERNMAYDCGIMIFMSFHAWGLLPGPLASAAGWAIVAVRLLVAFRAWRRARSIYKFKWSKVKEELGV